MEEPPFQFGLKAVLVVMGGVAFLLISLYSFPLALVVLLPLALLLLPDILLELVVITGRLLFRLAEWLKPSENR